MKKILYVLLPLLLVLVLAEAGLHLVEALTPTTYIGNESGKGYKAKAINHFVQEKINKLWSRLPHVRDTIMEPPFQVFVNKNFSDKERMDFIFKNSALPPNLNVTAVNFLRLNNSPDPYKFTTTTNSLSFRDPERSVKKPEGTFRIIVLGSYPAFGHGANDNETYPYYLEENFRKAGNFKNVEVWNGGRQGGTSIMGYARLINEIEQYSPDLILWDYGWIELYLGRDRIMHPKFEFIKRFNGFERFVFNICIGTPIASLKLCTITVRKLTKISYSAAIAGWKESMKLVREWGIQKNIPVMFLRHKGVTIPAKEYEVFHAPDKKFYFVDTSPSLSEAPRPDEVDDFWSVENWLTELNYKKEEVMANEPSMVFFGDAIQYNKIGYKRIADHLFKVIPEQFPEIRKSKRK